MCQSKASIAMISLGILVASTAVAQIAAKAPAEELRTGMLRGGADVEPGDCSGLFHLKLFNTTIGSATSSQIGQLHFCRVAGVARPTNDSNVNFEIWLPSPSKWNGKLYSSAGGSALGAILLTALQNGVERGYASMSDDRGHADRDDKGSTFTADGSWAPGHPQKIIDWGYRAQHVSTVATRNIVAAYYGKPVQHAYFESCSTGGQQALMEAERFPDDFDGIIAAAPAVRFTHAITTLLWAGMPARLNPANAISTDKLALLHKAVVNACDALDGVKDGLISQPFACTFDPGNLQCKSGDAPSCLTSEQVQTARKMYAGPTRPNGENISPGYLPGSELGWSPHMTGGPGSMSADFFRYWIYENKDYDSQVFDFDKDWVRVNEKSVAGHTMAEIVNTHRNLDVYRQRGGKVLLWIGGSDAAASPGAAASYYDTVASHSDQGNVDDVLRMYVAPGVSHCGGGEGPDKFDMLGTLEDWVERARMPDRIIATKLASDGSTARTLPLCPYPQFAQYRVGDVNRAESFVCAPPK